MCDQMRNSEKYWIFLNSGEKKTKNSILLLNSQLILTLKNNKVTLNLNCVQDDPCLQTRQETGQIFKKLISNLCFSNLCNFGQEMTKMWVCVFLSVNVRVWWVYVCVCMCVWGGVLYIYIFFFNHNEVPRPTRKGVWQILLCFIFWDCKTKIEMGIHPLFIAADWLHMSHLHCKEVLSFIIHLSIHHKEFYFANCIHILYFWTGKCNYFL